MPISQTEILMILETTPSDSTHNFEQIYIEIGGRYFQKVIYRLLGQCVWRGCRLSPLAGAESNKLCG